MTPAVTRVVAFVALLLNLAPSPAAPLACYRTQLVVNDPERNWTYCWSRAGDLEPAWTLAGRQVVRWRLGSQPSLDWWHQRYHGGFRITDAAPGTYRLSAGRGPDLDITVIAAPVRRYTRIAAGVGTAAKVRAALAAGYRDLELDSGAHVWESVVACPDWTTLRGPGAIIRLPANAGQHGTPTVAIEPGAYVTLYGLTWIGDDGGQVFERDTIGSPLRPGCVVARCDFSGVNLGWGLTGVLIRDCTFKGCGVNAAPSGMYLDCSFSDGPGYGRFTGMTRHAFYSNFPHQGTLALISPSFTRTERGLCFTTTYGPVANNLFLSPSYSQISRGDGELFLVEGQGKGYGFDGNLIVSPHSVGCTGTIFQLDENGSDNLVRWPLQDALGAGIRLGSPWTDVPGKSVTRNAFEGLGAWKPRVMLGPAAQLNTLDGTIMRPTEGLP